MKTRKRKMMALVICVLMLSTMVLPATAATVYWTDLDGTYNSATVEITSDWYYVYLPIDSATLARHTVGNRELITWPVGNSATYSVELNVSGAVYKTKVEEALEAEGLMKSITGPQIDTDVDEGYYEIPAGLPTGTYTYGYEVTVYDISWNVDLDMYQPIVSAYAAVTIGDQSGTVDAVPYSCTEAKLIPVE